MREIRKLAMEGDFTLIAYFPPYAQLLDPTPNAGLLAPESK
jgi:hypothetical protein